jgi:sugar phosphate isomerase/epimerase
VVIHPEHLFRTYEDATGYLGDDGVSLHSVLLPGIEAILKQVRSANIMLALENIQDWYDEIYFNSHQNMLKFLNEINHPSLQFTFDLMHAQVPGLLNDFTNSLANQIVNVHVSDLLPPTKRVAIGKGIIDWDCFMPKLHALPNICQLTVELSNPQDHELVDSVQFLSKSML